MTPYVSSTCLNAYNFLMASEKSSCFCFVTMRAQLLNENALINPFDMEKNKGIECALWPNLYLCTDCM